MPAPGADDGAVAPSEVVMLPGRCAAEAGQGVSLTRPLEARLGETMKVLSRMQRLEAGFDALVVHARLSAIERTARELEEVRQRAACLDTADAAERARLINFVAGYNTLAAQAAALRQFISDEQGLSAAMPRLNDTCRHCHTVYRPQ